MSNTNLEIKLISENSIIDQYVREDAFGKVDVILNNYTSFTGILDGYEKSIEFLILHDRRAKKRAELGDTGVRVQTSHLSDRTATSAIENVTLDKAVSEHEMDKELEGLENASEYMEVLNILWGMREDYELVEMQVRAIRTVDNGLLGEYLRRDSEALDFAEERGLTYSTMMKKLARARTLVKSNVEVYMNVKYGET